MKIFTNCFLLIISLFATILVRGQVNQWKKMAAQLDSAAFEKAVDPARYGLDKSPDFTLIGKWKNDPAVSADSLYSLLISWNRYQKPVRNGIICRYWIKITPSVSVPYFVYIPRGYDPSRKTAVLIYYKGGWLSRPQFSGNYVKEMVTDNPTFDYLDEYNMIEIFPALRQDLAIYGKYGYEHLMAMLTETKKRFNVDDNKVFLAGFSDGGKTVYNASFLLQTPFACFYPINGSFPSRPDFPNFINRPIYSIVAEKDELTVPQSIKSKAEYANRMGASWIYRELADKKHFYHKYASEVVPVLFRHMQVTSRQALPVSCTYDRGYNDSVFRGIDWLQISVDTKRPATAVHFTDSIHTYSMSGESSDYLYGEKTGQLRAHYLDNTFTITASKVDMVTLYISPLMVDLQKPVSVVINGKKVFEHKVTASKEFMAGWFLNNFDRAQLYVNKIEVAVSE
ncbi:MAG: hypothetical protein GXC78_11625 [Chitinophagaceae bacterium]|nr:hypothetical protein [Chitinophagaceae bacterium]